jgi:hypothetical protein
MDCFIPKRSALPSLEKKRPTTSRKEGLFRRPLLRSCTTPLFMFAEFPIADRPDRGGGLGAANE